jgi:hypothetical protein
LNKKEETQHLQHTMNLLRKIRKDFIKYIHYLQILLFPEGTDLTAGSRQRSHQFAFANQLERYYQVLHPKTTGFVFLVQRMRQSECTSLVEK